MTPEQQLADALAYEDPNVMVELAVRIEIIKAQMALESMRAAHAYAVVSNNGWMA